MTNRKKEKIPIFNINIFFFVHKPNPWSCDSSCRSIQPIYQKAFSIIHSRHSKCFATQGKEMMKTHEQKQVLPLAFALAGFFFTPLCPRDAVSNRVGSMLSFLWKATFFFTFQQMTGKILTAKSNNFIKRKPDTVQETKTLTLPLHGFSSVRQVHFNTVLPLVCLHANAIKQPSFPEFSIDCRTEANVTLLLPHQIISKALANRENAALWISFI